MAEESSKALDPNQLEKYEPQPRGQSRISNIALESVDKRLLECRDYFTKHVDEADYRNLDWYLWRMQLHYAAGDDIFQIVDDAFLAARCLHDRHEMHLDLKPPEMFMSRRITPVELGILSGMPMLTMEFSATYGLPLMMVMGNTAPEDIMSEANLMTSYFRRGFCADFIELTGLAAVIYAGVIAAIGRGFDDEATVGINTYSKARDSLRGNPPKAVLNKLQRYDALITALACLCAGQYDPIGEILANAAEDFVADQAKRSGESWLNPEKMPPPRYFDMSIVTILALAALRQVIIELPKTGAIAGYRDFIKGLTEMPERRLEMPELDEEARKILQEAGVNPDQIAGNYMDHSIQDAREASEARAAELFEERQRKAQEAVRAKIIQDAAEAEIQNKTEDQAQNAGQSYAGFFDNLTEKDIPPFDDGSHSDTQPQDAGQNYSNFFDNLSENDIPPFDDGSQDDQQGTKTFSANFFNEENKPQSDLKMSDDTIDVSQIEHETKQTPSFSEDFFDKEEKSASDLKMQDESESSSESHDKEKVSTNYASFFDNLDENAIPKYDDGSSDDRQQVKTFSADFFSEDHHVPSGLKMTLDPEPPKPVSQPEPEKKPVSETYIPTIEDNSPRRDFTKLFDENAPEPTLGLRMSLDDEENRKILDTKPHSDQKISDEPAEERADSSRDFSHFFSDEEAPKSAEQRAAESDRDAQIRELEEAQAQKLAEEAKNKESKKLKLALDGTEQAFKKPESYQDRMARIIAEKQAAAREMALREREESEREIEALKQADNFKPMVETLQMKPTESTDPDEAVQKAASVDDIVIKRFAHTDLDMIHDNTAQKADLEDDFDMYAALASKSDDDK